MQCIICGKEQEKLFKNGTCGFSCSATFRNRNAIENGTHNFSVNITGRTKCLVCQEMIINGNFSAHQKNCKLHPCLNCGKDLFDMRSKFCNRSCSGTFNNKGRILSDATKLKISTGVKANFPIAYPKPKLVKEQYIKCKCCSCGEDFNIPKDPTKRTYRRKTCSPSCKTISSIKGGKSSASVRNKRSKDEITLSNLCKTYFTKVENNKIIHDGWDADIVINEKYIIFWNGPWHYRDMKMKKVSLKQIQNRDAIKINLFMDLGYYIFIYEDRYFTPKQAFEDIKNHINYN